MRGVFLFFILFNVTVSHAFDVFDGTLYRNKPNLSTYHIQPTSIVYEESIFPNATSKKLPDKSSVERVSRSLQGATKKVVIVDIERWPLKGNTVEVRIAVDNYVKYMKLLRSFRIPSISIGYYGNLPVTDYGSSLAQTSSTVYKNWQKVNDQVKPMVNTVDVLYPSVYTFNNDQLNWRRYAIAQIAEARRIAPGKPVVAFIWPQFHGASNGAIRYKYIPAAFWRQQLELMYRIADGVVIWGGYNQQWDSRAPWWNETLDFMRSHNL